MRSNSATVFERLANAVTAGDIQRRFAFHWDAVAGSQETELLQVYLKRCGHASTAPVLLMAEYDVLHGLIVGDELPYGVWEPHSVLGAWIKDGKFDPELYDSDNDSLDEGATAGVREIDATCVVSADTPFLQLLRDPPNGLKRSGVYVVAGSKYSGVITPDDLLAPVVQPCLLAMAIEFERSALDLCRLYPNECVAALPEGRRETAKKTLAKKNEELTQRVGDKAAALLIRTSESRAARYGSDISKFASMLTIESTTLVDKFTMLRKCKLTLDVSHSRVKKVTGKIERLRNACAHPGFEGLAHSLTLSDLIELADEVHSLTSDFRNEFQRELRARNMLVAE